MTNSTDVCKTCRKPKANFHCGLCSDSICKSCAQFLEEGAFSFLRKVPADFTHPTYCTNCFDDKISAPLNDYNQKLEEAREVYIFTKDQTKQTRLLKRKEEPYVVENCEDEQEALLRMSFWAVEAKFNALIDIQLSHKKIIVGSHKKTIWAATDIPIFIDPDKVRGF